MKKTGLIILIFFISQAVFASFPKNITADSAQTSLIVVQPAVSPSDEPDKKEYKHFTQTHLSFIQKAESKLLRHWLIKRNYRSGKLDWIASVGGFLLGLTLGPLGFGISRLAKNQALRKGAAVGFKVFLIILAIYLALVLSVLLLFASLGLR